MMSTYREISHKPPGYDLFSAEMSDVVWFQVRLSEHNVGQGTLLHDDMDSNEIVGRPHLRKKTQFIAEIES